MAVFADKVRGTVRWMAYPAVAALIAIAFAPTAAAAPAARIVSETPGPGRILEIGVYSPSMDRVIPLQVLRAADTSTPAPTLYLLNGAGGGEDDASWQKKTDIVNGFLGDKNVNVVQPIGGKWSYYADWLKDDPNLGRNKWKTFFTEELPPLIDGALGTNGVNAIAGLSTSGTSVLNLAIAKPGLYKSVAAYSGCAETSSDVGREAVKLTVNTWGGGDVRNLYGEDNNPAWQQNDPVINAEGLRGTNLYVSSGNGLPGQWDTLNGPYTLPGAYGLGNQLVVGGVIEAATNYCSHDLQTKLNSINIPATYNFRSSGTHSWGYWHDDFIDSWPVLARGLGI